MCVCEREREKSGCCFLCAREAVIERDRERARERERKCVLYVCEERQMTSQRMLRRAARKLLETEKWF